MGITLRDLFAVLAMHALLAKFPGLKYAPDPHPDGEPWMFEVLKRPFYSDLAVQAYGMADAMLVRRDRSMQASKHPAAPESGAEVRPVPTG